jgi:hypothetical protein
MVPFGQDFSLRDQQLPGTPPALTTEMFVTVQEGVITNVVYYLQQIEVSDVQVAGNTTVIVDLLPAAEMTPENTFVLVSGAVRRVGTFLQPTDVSASLTDNVENQIEVYTNGADTLQFFIQIKQY